MNKFGIAVVFLLAFNIQAALTKTNFDGSKRVNWAAICNDTIKGTGIDEAVELLKAKCKTPKKNIVVGIVDSGIDTTDVEVSNALWSNPKEIMDGTDNDHNGYIDDMHGWNFLGTADGKFNMVSAGTEEYRQFKALFPKYKNMKSADVTDKDEHAYYLKMRKHANIDSYIMVYGYTMVKDSAYMNMENLLRADKTVGMDTLTLRTVIHKFPDNQVYQKSMEMITNDFLAARDLTMTWSKFRKKHDDELALMQRRLDSIEKAQDKRLLMGDNMLDENDTHYGNNTLMVDGYFHGTFIANLIAGQGVKNFGVRGLYTPAKLMIVRASPDGDEYDKDVSSAIRYAADNGAKVINLSLGKYTSPTPDMVNDAIAYAGKKDVLIINAAGNNGLNIDSVAYFPSAVDKAGKRLDNLMRVGSTDRKGKMCKFSNHGINNVDIYAPGEDIVVMLGGEENAQQGTSLSAPIVASVAAMIRHYFPKMKAAQVKDLLMKSSKKIGNLKIVDAVAAARAALKD